MKEQLTKILVKIWQYLDGNKTLLGTFLLYVMERADLPKDSNWVFTAEVCIFLFTGVGLGHKMKKGTTKVLQRRQDTCETDLKTLLVKQLRLKLAEIKQEPIQTTQGTLAKRPNGESQKQQTQALTLKLLPIDKLKLFTEKNTGSQL